MDVGFEMQCVSSAGESIDLKRKKKRKKKRRKNRDMQTDRSHEMTENEQYDYIHHYEGDVLEISAGGEKNGHKRKLKKRKKGSKLPEDDLSEASPKYEQYLECEKEISIDIESPIHQKKKKRKKEYEVGEQKSDDVAESELCLNNRYVNVDSMGVSSQEKSSTHKRKKKKQNKEFDNLSSEILSPNDELHFEQREISTERNSIEEPKVQKKKKKRKRSKNDCDNLTETHFHEVTSADEDIIDVLSTCTSKCKKRKRIRWRDQQATEHSMLDCQDTGTSEAEESQGASGISALDVKGYIEQLRGKVGIPAITRISDAEWEIKSRTNKFRYGRWLPEEDAILRENIEYFQELHPSVDVLKGIISRKGLSGRDQETRKFKSWRVSFAKKTGLYSRYLVRGLSRSAHACNRRVKLMFSGYTKTGKWSKEETELLKDYMKVYGRDWRLLADKLGRDGRHVIDKYRNVSQPSLGLWTVEEDNRLKASIFKHCGTQSSTNDLLYGIPWTAIANDVMTRNGVRCWGRWHSFLRHYSVHEAGFAWTKQKVITLISEICKQGVVYEELIDFNSIRQSIEGNPSILLMSIKFSHLKKSIPKSIIQSFPDLLDAIYTKHCTKT